MNLGLSALNVSTKIKNTAGVMFHAGFGTEEACATLIEKVASKRNLTIQLEGSDAYKYYKEMKGIEGKARCCEQRQRKEGELHSGALSIIKTMGV